MDVANGGPMKLFSLFLFVLGFHMNAQAIERIPNDAFVCVVNSNTGSMTYSCDGAPAAKLESLTSDDSDLKAVQRRSGQLVKFIRLGYRVQTCEDELTQCILTR